MKLFLVRLFFLFLVEILLATYAWALDIPDKPLHYVNDYIQLLSQEANDRLEKKLAEFEKNTSNQVFIAIFDSLEGDSLEDFSIRLATQWKAGQSSTKNIDLSNPNQGRDNGIILLIFKSDRKVRIEVGYGLEGALPDAIASIIIQNDIVPNFRAGNFDGGVEQAISNIILATKNEYVANKSKEKGDSPIIAILTVMFMMIILIYCLRNSKSGISGRTYTSGWSSGRSSSGGGGFGGGGGGSFGGGGASGKW